MTLPDSLRLAAIRRATDLRPHGLKRETKDRWMIAWCFAIGAVVAVVTGVLV